MPKWFEDMNAPVTAVAMLTKLNTVVGGEQGDPDGKVAGASTGDETETPSEPEQPDPEEVLIQEELEENLEAAKNVNVVVGNWEVQNWYKNDADKRTLFGTLFGSELYVNAWNMFSDIKVHYKNGELYRTENIKILDNVVLKDYSKTGASRYSDDNVSFGTSGLTTETGTTEKKSWDESTKESSVHQTRAAANKINKNSYRYNEKGNPYIWEELDSIDVDFEPETSFNEGSPYLSKDWDLELGYYSWSNAETRRDGWTGSNHPNVGVGTLLHNKYKANGTEDSSKEKGAWDNHLRIHSTININDPYKARTVSPPRESMSLPDILWMRIESEPMLRYPDSSDDPYTKKNMDVKAFSSVRQLILSFNVSNSNTNNQEYRPLVIFYDDPETYYPYSKSENSRNKVRTSKPVIVNLKVPFRVILYAPNSPVVVMGEARDSLQGFIVAKKYVRLKTAADFNKENDDYYKKHGSYKYTVSGSSYQTNFFTDNPYYGINHTTIDKDGNVTATYYRDNGEPKTIAWLYTKINNPDNGIDMYVDDYGNVQYVDIEDPPKSYGSYNTFGRTDFTSHGYHIMGTSANNMLLSGK